MQVIVIQIKQESRKYINKVIKVLMEGYVCYYLIKNNVLLSGSGDRFLFFTITFKESEQVFCLLARQRIRTCNKNEVFGGWHHLVVLMQHPNVSNDDVFNLLLDHM